LSITSQINDELDEVLAQGTQQASKSQKDAFDTFVNASATDVTVAPFQGQALLWWSHQSSLNGLKQMAFDVLGTPGELCILDV
jgi:hypothetical protein